MTPKSISKNVLNAVTGATDIAATSGVLQITGAPAIRQSKVVSARWIPGFAGQGQRYLLTTATPVVGKTYTFQIVQPQGQQDVITLITVVSATTDPATFYAAVEAAVTASGRFDGTVTSDVNGVVLTGSVTNAFFTVSTITTGAEAWTVTASAVTATPSGITVSTTASTPTVLTVPSQTGRTVGGLYRFTLTGFTGADAAVINGETAYGVLTSLTSISLFFATYDPTPLVITTGAGTRAEFLPNQKETYKDSFGTDTNSVKSVTDYIESNNYLGLEVVYFTDGDPGEADLRLNPKASQTLFITNNTAATLFPAYLGATAAVGQPISGTL
jgi:hypothetical protein